MRTVVDIPKEERAWLDKKAKEKGVSMAEALRQTLRADRLAEQKQAEFKRLSDKVFGSWTQGDGLAYQRKLRAEWDR